MSRGFESRPQRSTQIYSVFPGEMVPFVSDRSAMASIPNLGTTCQHPRWCVSVHRCWGRYNVLSGTLSRTGQCPGFSERFKRSGG